MLPTPTCFLPESLPSQAATPTPSNIQTRNLKIGSPETLVMEGKLRNSPQTPLLPSVYQGNAEGERVFLGSKNHELEGLELRGWAMNSGEEEAFRMSEAPPGPSKAQQKEKSTDI